MPAAVHPRPALFCARVAADDVEADLDRFDQRCKRQSGGVQRRQVNEPAGPRKAVVRKLRALAPHSFADIAGDGAEFALVMVRRSAGMVEVLGEVPDDVALVERAALKLAG